MAFSGPSPQNKLQDKVLLPDIIRTPPKPRSQHQHQRPRCVARSKKTHQVQRKGDFKHKKMVTLYGISGQITRIPKPELRAFWGDSLT